MAEKIKFTRPELKRHRDMLVRFERYLPMLKLKQQQLQLTIQQVSRERNAAYKAVEDARRDFERYDKLMNDVAGLDVRGLGEYQDIKTYQKNIAGVAIPVFEDVVFPELRYSLFSTSAWVDRAIFNLRELNKRRARLEIVERQHDLLQRELTKIIQRVNLFEKIKIPEAKENIRRIRIHLGDEMASAVGRAKIAKAKLAEVGSEAG